MEYNIIPVLTEHGTFNAYFKGIQNVQPTVCNYCKQTPDMAKQCVFYGPLRNEDVMMLAEG